MKKLIVGSVAVGAVMALRPVVKRRMVQKMHEHCKQMATQHEHCVQVATQHEERSEPVATA